MPAAEPMEPLWLGVDLGTQGVRADLVDATGALVGAGSAPLPAGRAAVRDGPDGRRPAADKARPGPDGRPGPGGPRTASDGRHEQDPRDWWEATRAAVRDALAHRHGRRLGGLSIDSTSGTLVTQDRSGRPLGPGLMYDDRRAADLTDRVREAGAALWDELGYRMQPSWALPKVVWLSGRLPAGAVLAHQADHVAARLAGHAVATDTSHALKAGYDLLRLRWPADVLDRLGVDPAVLPEVVLPGTPVAEVGAEGAEATGIPAGTPILAGMTDGCAAQVASAALRPGDWCSALGTTLVLKGCTADLLRDPTGAVYCHRNPDGGWLPGGASSTGAGVLADWLPGADLAALTPAAAALGVPSGATYPLVGAGERFPFSAADARGFDLDAPADPDPATRLSRAAHGVAYVERLAFDTLGALGADVAGPVVAIGGATANDWWTRLRADVLGRPVHVPRRAGSAFGSAVLAAAAPGRLAETARAMTRFRARFDPEPRPGLEDGYRRLVAALRERGWLAVAPAGVCAP